MSTKYEMWLTYDAEKEKIKIPVLPETLSVSDDSGNDSVRLTDLGETTILQSPSAKQISFSSFFPAASFPGVTVSDSPLSLVQRIQKWKRGDKPVHFLVTQCGLDLYCTIERFSYSESGGDVGTISYSLTLKEYREITVRQVTVNIASAAASVQNTAARVDNSTIPKTYTVVRGDCLWNIAKRFYGSGSQYTKIYNANKSIIGGNPNLIYAGQVLTIPA